jgi:hypothetical protein
MMPLVRSTGATRQERLAARIRHTRRLLTVAACIMSLYLLGSALVTTLLIPAAAFGPSGEANGRALAYLAHEYLGNGFGTVYDLSSVLILWFAGASAMAGLINIVPRYLPAYGMTPDWTRAVRPVVLVYTTVSILITVVFQADIDAQAGAYATGILAMMVSGTIAVAISAARARQRPATVGFTVLTMALLYALVQNELRRPDGIVISVCFILGIISVSLVSRVARTTELRVDHLELDDTARDFITEAVDRDQRINLIAHRPHPPTTGHRLRRQGTRGAPGQRHPGPGTGDLPGDRDLRPLRLQPGPGDPRPRDRPAPGAARQEPGRAQRHRSDRAGPARCHRGHPPRLLRMVRGQPRGAPDALPAPRAR